MKIRMGFVSNSSSSSFICKFPEKITSQEQLKEYLDFSGITSIITHKDILEMLFNDIQMAQNWASEKIDLDALESWNIIDLMHEWGLEMQDFKYKTFEDHIKDRQTSNMIKLTYGDDSKIDTEFEHNIAPKIFGKYLVEIINNH